MGDPGFLHFPGSLDPRAQEFRPTNYLTLVPPHIYYPYPCPPYPFCEGGVGYPQFSSPTAYVSPTTADPPLPPNLPPPSPTPSRTLLLSSVPADVSESTVRRELEVFGDVRAVQMERVWDGIVTVHFYDLRNAQTALMQIQEQHMQQQSRLRKHFVSLLSHNSLYEQKILVPPLPPPARGLIAGRAVWAQFMIPVTVGLPVGHNQGTLVIFNLESEVPTTSLKEIFETFGCVKEFRETPLKRHQRFVEFYDIRDAAKALEEMNGKEIYGKHVVIEFSRPGGHSKKFLKPTQNTTNKFNSFTNLPTKTSQFLALPPPPPPPPPPPRKISGRTLAYVPPRISNSQPQSCSKKSNFSTKSGAVQAAMGSLCISGGIGNGIIEESSNRPPKKNFKKNFGSATIISTKQQQQQQQSKGSRTWKGSRKCKDFDPRFLINQDAIMELNCRDSRTTVMIKNIPNKYSQKLLLNMLDNHCIHCNEQIADGDDQPLSSYDFVYLPIDFINKCNVGYGFVNMTSPQATLRLYKAFHLQNWEVFNSRKICEVTYARLQGVEALKEHFKNSKFPCEADEYMPVVFTPPRDGRRLTEPIPIAGRANNNSPSPPAVTSSEATDDVMDGGYLPQPPHFGQNITPINVNHNDDGDEDDVSGCRSRSSSSSNGGDVYDQEGND